MDFWENPGIYSTGKARICCYCGFEKLNALKIATGGADFYIFAEGKIYKAVVTIKNSKKRWIAKIKGLF